MDIGSIGSALSGMFGGGSGGAGAATAGGSSAAAGSGSAAAGGGATAAGGDPSMAIAQMLLQIGGQAILNQRADERDRKNVREYKNKLEDIDLRSEATYRGNRSMLQNAIGKYYAKKGWELPKDTMPGYGTTRALPGEEELYPEYDVPKAEWYYGKKDKEAPEEQESTQGQEEVVTAPAPYTGSVSSPIMGTVQEPVARTPQVAADSRVLSSAGGQAPTQNLNPQTEEQLKQILGQGGFTFY